MTTYTPWSLEWLLEEPRLNVAKWSAEVVLCVKFDQVAKNEDRLDQTKRECVGVFHSTLFRFRAWGLGLVCVSIWYCSIVFSSSAVTQARDSFIGIRKGSKNASLA